MSGFLLSFSVWPFWSVSAAVSAGACVAVGAATIALGAVDAVDAAVLMDATIVAALDHHHAQDLGLVLVILDLRRALDLALVLATILDHAVAHLDRALVRALAHPEDRHRHARPTKKSSLNRSDVSLQLRPLLSVNRQAKKICLLKTKTKTTVQTLLDLSLSLSLWCATHTHTEREPMSYSFFNACDGRNNRSGWRRTR